MVPIVLSEATEVVHNWGASSPNPRMGNESLHLTVPLALELVQKYFSASSLFFFQILIFEDLLAQVVLG